MDDYEMPEAWPEGLAEMRMLDSSLRCPICGDFFTDAVCIRGCGHSYCSVCIRRSLSFKEECPTCRVSNVTTDDIAPNRTIDAVVKHFKASRGAMLSLATAKPPEPEAKPEAKGRTGRGAGKRARNSSPEPPTTAPKRVTRARRAADKDLEDGPPLHGREGGKLSPVPLEPFPAPSGAFAAASPPGRKDAIVIDDDEEDETEEEEEEYRPDHGAAPEHEDDDPSPVEEARALRGGGDGGTGAEGGGGGGGGGGGASKVECPVCGIRIFESLVNQHLNVCLAKEDGRKNFFAQSHAQRAPAETRLSGGSGELRSDAGTGIPGLPGRVPKLCYQIMKDAEIKKHLAKYKLPTKGDRKTLINRHKEFAMRANACIDGGRRHTLGGLVEEVLKQEKQREKGEAQMVMHAKVAAKGGEKAGARADNHFEELKRAIEERKRAAAANGGGATAAAGREAGGGGGDAAGEGEEEEEEEEEEAGGAGEGGGGGGGWRRKSQSQSSPGGAAAGGLGAWRGTASPPPHPAAPAAGAASGSPPASPCDTDITDIEVSQDFPVYAPATEAAPADEGAGGGGWGGGGGGGQVEEEAEAEEGVESPLGTPPVPVLPSDDDSDFEDIVPSQIAYMEVKKAKTAAAGGGRRASLRGGGGKGRRR